MRLITVLENTFGMKCVASLGDGALDSKVVLVADGNHNIMVILSQDEYLDLNIPQRIMVRL